MEENKKQEANQQLNQQPTQITTETTPIEPKQSKFLSKKGLILILVLLALISITGTLSTIFLNINRQVEKSKTNLVVKIPTPTSVILPKLTASETATWKTYKGNGFLFKYPSDWNVSNIHSQKDVNLAFEFQNIDYSKIYEDYENITSKEEIIVSGFKATKILDYVDFSEIGKGIEYRLTTYVNTNKNPFVFDAWTSSKGSVQDKKIEIIYNQILATIKLTDPAPDPILSQISNYIITDTKSGKLFTQKAYGFSFEYNNDLIMLDPPGSHGTSWGKDSVTLIKPNTYNGPGYYDFSDSVSIYIVPNTKNLSFSNFVNNEIHYEDGKIKTNIKVIQKNNFNLGNLKNGAYFKDTSWDDDIYYFPYAENKYFIVIYVSNDYDKNFNIQTDKIFTTFKFTN